MTEQPAYLNPDRYLFDKNCGFCDWLKSQCGSGWGMRMDLYASHRLEHAIRELTAILAVKVKESLPGP